MKISVFGLGYVGAVSAACLARRGHEVVGVDVNPRRSTSINDGVAPCSSPGSPEAIAAGGRAGRLRATTDAAEAVRATEVSLVCVGTPSGSQGSLSTGGARARVRRRSAPRCRTAQRGTRSCSAAPCCPAPASGTLIPASSRRARACVAGKDFGVAVNPEFLREGTASRDFYDPPKTVIGELDAGSGDAVAALYAGFPGDGRSGCRSAVAEMAKYVDNAFHALKVGFANEIGAPGAALGVDSHERHGDLPGRPQAEHHRRPTCARASPSAARACPRTCARWSTRRARADVARADARDVLPSNEAHFRARLRAA